MDKSLRLGAQGGRARAERRQRTVDRGADVGEGGACEALHYRPEVGIEIIRRAAKLFGKIPGPGQMGTAGGQLGVAKLRRQAEADKGSRAARGRELDHARRRGTRNG